jgi:serine/threonine protein kinase
MADKKNKETIGRYEILKKVGQGSKGAVYLGRDPYIERQVAVKTYRLPDNIGSGELEQYQKRFFVEAQSAGSLMHPNIVTIYDAGLHQDFCYITMEYIDGSTLEKFCDPNNLLPLEKVLKSVFSVCKA